MYRRVVLKYRKKNFTSDFPNLNFYVDTTIVADTIYTFQSRLEMAKPCRTGEKFKSLYGDSKN